MTKNQLSQLGKTLWAIADRLSFLGALIKVHAEELAPLQKHRNGLMQQLFPSFGARG